MELADKMACTGCGACAYVCPKQCISFQNDTYGASHPFIDNSRCIDCGRCQTYCPAINQPESYNPIQAYAAWSSDAEERRTSASGGIAAEIYKHAINNGWAIVGASFHDGFEVKLKLTDNIATAKEFKNSKYVFSSAIDIYQDINKRLKDGSKIAIIALPCQIAAIKKVFQKNLDNLLLVDLVCHGTTPHTYLEQYIRYMGARCHKQIDTITFRDVEAGTQKFALSLFGTNGEKLYSSTSFKDTYQFAYHRMIAYRENCYHCRYANSRRSSDITIGDYKGLGKSVPCDFSEEKISCILVNTEKGSDCINTIIDKKQIIALRRPIEEPINGDCQLRHPALKSYSRRLFEKRYDGDFMHTMHSVYIRTRFKEILSYSYKRPMHIVKKILGVFSSM